MNDDVIMRIDDLVQVLEMEGYPPNYIYEQLEEYLAICNELSHL
jgi:hypothetical protein